MDLVAEDAIDPADANRIARKIAGLVMADSAAEDVTDINAMLVARFGATVVTERKAAITGSGLSIGMLEDPGLQLEVGTGDDAMVDASPAAVTPNGFEGALFSEGLTEGLLGGRNLMTYAYTDVKDPWEENFETAYGKLVVDDEVPNPGGAPKIVPNPGTGVNVTGSQISEYNTYLTEKAEHDIALAAYQRELAEITEDDFTGNPMAGGPSNTPTEMLVVDAEDGDRVVTENEFWKLAIINPEHLPQAAPKPSGAIVDPATPVVAQYRPVVDQDDAEEMMPSHLSGQFDGIDGVFVCESTGTLCQISVVRTDKTEGARVRTVVEEGKEPYNVEYSFEAVDTWKFIATDRAAFVDTMRKDGDYLVMGWWLEAPARSTGDFRFGRFFAGSDPYGAADVMIPSPNDSATYTGSAVGKYAERDIDTDTARKGLFTATAELKANFADDMIKGTIEDFMDDSGMPRPWHVVLEETGIADGAFADAATSGEAYGQDWTGSWEGEFYGRGDVPSSVAGLFNATFGCPETGGCDRDGDDTTPLEGAGVGFVGVSGVFGAHHSEMENFAQPTDDN